MPAIPVPIHFCLNQEHLIDIFILQWHTPEPFEHHTWRRMRFQDAEKRGRILQKLQNWLCNNFDRSQPVRPLFLIAPELSVSIQHMVYLDQLAEQLKRPAVIIAGLEYLEAQQYLAIRQSLPEMTAMTNWREDIPDGCVVNATAIWIHDGLDGNIRKYIQPKLHPCDEESTYLYSGSNYLLFKSSNQEPGSRLNFCVQICSDFNNEQYVENLRRELAEHLTLDLTFLLQCNRDQERTQLKEAIKKYFEPSSGMVATENGCLLCVNNASPDMQNINVWGQSKFCFRYKHKCRELESPYSTFWLKDEGDFDHQAVIFRESLPGIYWVTYVPHYLLRRIPGSDAPLPFVGRKFCYEETLDNNSENGNSPLSFASIQPVCHWVNTEWEKGGHELYTENKKENSTVTEDVASLWYNSYRQGSAEWKKHLADNERVARNVLTTEFLCWDDKDDHTDFPITEAEPQNWDREVSKGVKRMMRVYALLRLVLEKTSNRSIAPAPEGLRHVVIDNSTAVTFMYGGAIQPATNMLNKYMHEAEKSNVVFSIISGRAFEQPWLVMLAPQGIPDKERLLDNISRFDRGVTPPNANAGAHLQPPGDVVAIPPLIPKVVYDVRLLDKPEVATDGNGLRTELAQALKE